MSYGACCIYRADGALDYDGMTCDNFFTQEGCASRCERWHSCAYYIYEEDITCGQMAFEHDADHDWLDGCVRRAKVCCLPRGECTLSSSETNCTSLGGVYDSSHSACTPDSCEAACCLPDGRCANARVTWCRDMEGEVHWGKNCSENPCPAIPKPCCLCRGQCQMTSEGECGLLGGVWQEAYSDCATAANRCNELNVLPPCRHARFTVSRDQTDATRYRPRSIDLMEPHEYERGPAGTNCRTWFGNVSATRGAWACGQWNKDNPATKQYVPLQVRIDPVTGRGSFWTSYRPVCPEYEEAGVN